MDELDRISQEDLIEAHRAIASLLHKCTQAFAKLTPGTAQHTLMKNRIKALQVASTLTRSKILE